MDKALRFILIPLLCAIPAAGQTINASSCSQADVQTAFNSVVNSTTTVNIPAGSSGCHWSAAVTLTVPSGNTSLSIIGAGSLSTTGGGDSTVITDDYNSGNNLLVINGNSTSTSIVRLAGISFVTGAGPVKYTGLIALNGSEQFRFDHSHLNTSGVAGTAGMRINGCIYGVADHDIIDTAVGLVNNGIQQDNQGTCYSDALGLGDQAWSHATNFGSSKAFYIENSTFNNGFGNDCTDGGSFVMRFNTVNASGSGSTFQTHPTGGGGRTRGCRQWEVYKNTWVFSTSTPTFMNSCMFISSGTGLIWGNTIPSSSANGGTGCKQLLSVESILPNNVAYPQTATPAGWGYCGTSSGLTGQGSNWNGSTTGSGYPCLDQPGRGQGDLLTGGFTADGSGSNNVTNNATGCTSSASCAYPRQALEPIYEWLDAYSAIPSNTTNVFTANSSTGTTFNDNVDIYHWCDTTVDPGLANGCTSAFNGTVGTGSGTLASRPATCTAGTAYWATDQGNWNTSGSGGQGQLYKCTATNTWTLFYTPYSYPHPLIGGNVNANTPTFSPVAGTYSGVQSVTISTTSGGAIICYNTSGSPATNGSTGCTTGTLYSGPVSVATSETLYAVAGGTGYNDSSVGSAAYTITNGAASTPTFSPVAGTYTGTQTVTISTSTSGATICYTTDGTTPTANGSGTCVHGTTYSSTVSVALSETLKAIASKSAFTDSAVGSATYVINAGGQGSVTVNGVVKLTGVAIQ